MGFDLEEMRAKALLMADPNSGYTQDDFNSEFGEVNPIITDPDIYKLKLLFVNKSSNQDPDFATIGSSGFDLRADVGEHPVIIPVGKRAIIPTGLFFNIPSSFEIQIRPRSGLAAKNGVTVLNSPGTIDSDYRGEIKVILINHGDEDFVITTGDRIAQGVLCSVVGSTFTKLIKVDDIDSETERGSGGFGSTGVK